MKGSEETHEPGNQPEDETGPKPFAIDGDEQRKEREPDEEVAQEARKAESTQDPGCRSEDQNPQRWLTTHAGMLRLSSNGCPG
jgi:hypothetical protein